MKKLGNNESQILNELLKTAEKAKPVTQVPKEWFDIIKTPVAKQRTLREILAQVAEPLGEPPLDAAGAGGLGDETEAPLPEAQTPGECPQEVKQSLVDALLAACGSIEQAHSCLDELGGGIADGGEGLAEAPAGTEALPPPEPPVEAPQEMPMM
jgi:hypothetical protein